MKIKAREWFRISDLCTISFVPTVPIWFSSVHSFIFHLVSPKIKRDKSLQDRFIISFLACKFEILQCKKYGSKYELQILEIFLQGSRDKKSSLATWKSQREQAKDKQILCFQGYR